jgi:DNA recombination protein RmuC
MNVLVPATMFLIGFAAGGGILWHLLRKQIIDAGDRERNNALADIRVAESQVAAKEARIKELQTEFSQRDQILNQRNTEILQLKQQQAVVVTSMKKEQEKIAEKISLLNEAEKQFKEAFKVLAAEALAKNNEDFDKRARPLTDTLDQIKSKIDAVNGCAANLGTETSKLVKALQKPEVRGQWGEMHLLRVVEVTGMTDRCDFHEQQVIGDERHLRPDLVVHLPGGKNLAIDAKAPIRAFLESAEAADDDFRQLKQQEFVAHVREHVRLLGSKAYHQSLDCTPEFVVLYLPTEAIFSAALAMDADLLEYATKQRVHLAGPTVLITLLRAVAYGWKQESLAAHANDICNLAEELYKRLATFGGHMGKVGTGLNKAVAAYNQAVGSLESRVMTQARRFEKLGAAPVDVQIEELAQIESLAKDLQCAELVTASTDSELTDASTLLPPR